MKNYFSLALLSLLFVLNLSCGKDENDVAIQEYFSVESGKNQLENNMIDALNKIDAFRNDNALNEIIELAEFLNTSSGVKNSSFKNVALTSISNVSSLKNADFTIFNAKQSIALIEDTSLMEDYNNEKGTYLWDDSLKEFIKTGESDDIIYNVEYNNKVAVFSFTDFNTTTVTGSDINEEVPTLITANLKINNTIVFSQNFNSTFQNNELVPSSINNTTTIGAFSFITTYSNLNNTKATQSFNFKIGKDIILGYSLESNGMFSNQNGGVENGNIEDVIDNVTLNFNILDANLLLTATDKDFDSDIKLSIDEAVARLNSNVKGKLSIKGQIIAESQFYKDQDTHTNFYWDYNAQQFYEEEITEDIVNLRFLFSDGSTNDFETYFNGSFTEMETKFEAVFDAYIKHFENI